MARLGTGHSENERGNDVSGVEEPQQEASGGNEPAEAGEGSVPDPAVKVNKALKKIATEITKQTGIEVVTDEKEAQRALKDAEATGFIEHYVDANGYFYTFRVDKNHHIYMDEAISETSSANRERINRLKEYYDGERERYFEEVHSNRSETQSELGRSEDSIRSTVGARDSEDSAMGRRIGESDQNGNVERDISRPEQSGSALKEKEGEGTLPLLPEKENPDPKFNPIEAAAEAYKKEHPLSEEEISGTTAFDHLPEDRKQYCIYAALDYLHGEDTSAISEVYYRNIYEKRGEKRNTSTTDPMEASRKAADEYDNEKKQTSVKSQPVETKKQTRKELEAERDAADNAFESFMKELQKKRR